MSVHAKLMTEETKTVVMVAPIVRIHVEHLNPTSGVVSSNYVPSDGLFRT